MRTELERLGKRPKRLEKERREEGTGDVVRGGEAAVEGALVVAPQVQQDGAAAAAADEHRQRVTVYELEVHLCLHHPDHRSRAFDKNMRS